MLDTNTNKTLWISIAVGVVALLGVAGTALYPDAMNNGSSQVRNVALTSAYQGQNLLLNADGSFNKATTPKADVHGWQHSADYKDWVYEVPANSTWSGIYFDVGLKQNWYIGDKYTIKSEMWAESEGLVFSLYGGMYMELPKTEKTNATPKGPVSTTNKKYFAQGSRANAKGNPVKVPVLGQQAGGPDDNYGNNVCIFFENPTDHPIKVHISNVQLYRGWVN